MSEPRIISAREADQWLLSDDVIPDEVTWDLAHTVLVLAEQTAAVLALHVEDEDVKAVSRCAECIKFYPCPTARALGVEE